MGTKVTGGLPVQLRGRISALGHARQVRLPGPKAHEAIGLPVEDSGGVHGSVQAGLRVESRLPSGWLQLFLSGCVVSSLPLGQLPTGESPDQPFEHIILLGGTLFLEAAHGLSHQCSDSHRFRAATHFIQPGGL